MSNSNPDLLAAYYAQRQVVENLKRTLHEAEVELEKLRRLILPETPSPEKLELK